MHAQARRLRDALRLAAREQRRRKSAATVMTVRTPYRAVPEKSTATALRLPELRRLRSELWSVTCNVKKDIYNDH